MGKNFTIIGGDLRIIKLASMLSKDNNFVYAYGLENYEQLYNNKNIVMCNSLDEAIMKSDIIIGPIPFTSNGKELNTPFSKNKILIENIIYNKNINKRKLLIAGSIPQNIYEISTSTDNDNVKIIDIMKEEELAILNTIATAEGAISEAILNTDKILQESQILILGFGRIGKVLSQKLKALSAIVTCAARKDTDIAWIKTYGYNYININKLGENLNKYDIIINTAPHIILDENNMEYIKNGCLLIDLASKPGGIDQKVAKEKNLKLIWALALPGKIAPTSSAEFIKDTIYNIIKKEK